MNYETIRHIVNFENQQNKDGSLTDIKFYIEEERFEDGTVRGFNMVDYSTKTVSNFFGSEVVVSENINKMDLDSLYGKALGCIYDSFEFHIGSSSYNDIDLGGSL